MADFDPVMPTYAPSMVDLQRRQKMAEMLRNQAMESPQGQMVSGHYVAPSWTQYAAQLLKGYMGGQMDKEATQGQADLAKQYAEAKQANIQNYLQSMPQERDVTSYPQKQAAEDAQGEALFQGKDVLSPEASPSMGAPMTQHVVPTDQEQTAWLMKGATNPDLLPAATLGSHLFQKKEDRAIRQQDILSAQAARADEAQKQRDFMAANNEANRQNATAIANLKVEKAPNWSTVQTDNGIVQVNPKTGEVRPLGINPASKAGASSATQHISDAKESNALLDQVEKVGPLATGSGLGVARDFGAKMFGSSTEGAENAAKMKVLGASLTAKVPKMSGPQSDKDVAMYKEAAGNISDPMTPWPLKKAAIETIREINNRQLGYKQAESAAPSNVDIHSAADKILGL